ncbi:hypothetical protein LCGC14_0794140 [marine sediment metagenome]|uniref:Uncharacterized protein n=1 Tax=marine sediment metagenome TaxID=412755 RepID=A0A0F9QBD1_9ZZZZ
MKDKIRIEKHYYNPNDKMEVINMRELLLIACNNGYDDSVNYLIYLLTVKDKVVNFPGGYIKARNEY